MKLEALAENHHEQSLLAVVPLVDTEGHMHGVLAVKDMHFMAFQQQNLNLLALLGYYVGNQLTRSRGEALSRADWFLAELDTVLRFAHSHNTESSLLSLKFYDNSAGEEAASYVSESIRNLDSSWIVKADDGAPVLCLVLPLMTETQCVAFLKRIDRNMLEKYDLSLNDMLIGSMVRQITDTDTQATCLRFLESQIGQESLKHAIFSGDEDEEQSGVA